ncbi:MAG: CDP-glycerol glycerophosphotransferase family protein [Saprospiraceae bacterium]|nr:CDP-glycerol glycerophosphotransferase family protein [Saprospiraceae bacterium]
MKRKILHIVGSLNQTKQLHKISLEMPEYDHYFSQFFGEGILFKWMAESGWLDWTIMGTQSAFRREQHQYLQSVQANYDYRGDQFKDEYEMVFMCSDLMVPKKFPHAKLVFVQEGMTDPVTRKSMFVKNLGLPAWFAGDTSLNGCSNKCDLYCVASEGYSKFFSEMGTDASKIRVTGIPNFDHVASFTSNNFPEKDYVLVCTSDIREVGGKENRVEFLNYCKKVAQDRKIIFKLHPNEKPERATHEIRKVFGELAVIYTSFETETLIANCGELITQYSSVVYIGMALGKKVHSFFPLSQLKERVPIQNGGTSAKLIAELAKSLLLEEELEFIPALRYYRSA